MSERIYHFGVKGMKWGVRKQKQLDSYKRIASGKGKVLERIRLRANVTVVEFAKNKGNLQKIAAGRAAMLEAQKKRVEEGKSTTLDKLDRALNTPIKDLVRGR